MKLAWRNCGGARRSLGWIPFKAGLKDFAALLTGEKIEAQNIYRGAQQALATAQRAVRAYSDDRDHLPIIVTSDARGYEFLTFRLREHSFRP